MGHQAIIYGRVQEYWEGTAASWPIVPEYNRAVLESLPDEDRDWPFLTRHMFAVAPRPFHGGGDRGFYRGHIVHFACSLKDEPGRSEHWDKFLHKLESTVLQRLLWVSAKVHIESLFHPERTYLYRADADSLGEVLWELKETGFARRLVSEVRWSRREWEEGAARLDWLY
jgi:hypothetical protein